MSLPAWLNDADVPAEPDIPSDDALASTKALGIPELLQIILLQVPVEYLTTLHPVARLWRNIIFKLNHLEPGSIGHGDADCLCLCKDVCTDIPHYTGRFAIRGNPAFAYTHVYRTTTKDHNGEDIIPTTQRHYRGLKVKSWVNISRLDASDNHFITDPPITLVALGNSGYGYTHVKAMLRVSTGIRVGDLRDVFAKMHYAKDGSGSGRPYDARPSAWYAYTSEIVRRIGDTGNGESEHDSGDDFAAEMLTLSFDI
jgi:hypothetical protein